MKMKTIKKYAALFLATLMALSVVAGCGAQDGQETATSDATSAANAQPVTLTVECFDTGTMSPDKVDKNYYLQYVADNFTKETNITVKFVPVKYEDQANQLNLMMAARTAPDISTENDGSLVANFAAQGAATDLTDLIAQYGQNLSAFEGPDALKECMFYGKLYAVPKKQMNRGIIDQLIRKDWLDKVGLPVPTTTDELHNALLAFKQKDPGGFGKDTVPWSIAMGGIYRGYYSVSYTFVDFTQVDDRMWNTAPFWVMPGYKDYCRTMNQWYNEGLLSPDFALDTDAKTLEADWSNGKAGMSLGNLGHMQTLLPALLENVPTAEVAAFDPFTGKDGKHTKLGYPLANFFNFIPAFAKPENAVAAMKYMDWLSRSENLMVASYGIEGKNYDMVDGVPTPRADDPDAIDSFVYQLIATGAQMDDPEKIYRNYALSILKQVGLSSNEKAVKLIMDSNRNALTDTKVWPTLNGSSNTIATDQPLLDQMQDGMFIKIFTCKPGEFDSVYEAQVKQYMDAGGTEVQKEKEKIYDQLKAAQ